MKTNTINYLPLYFIFIVNDRILSIPYIEIKSIVCDKPYIILETITKRYHLSQNLTGFCSGLPPFIIQCNKSTYINLLQVASIKKNTCGYEACIDENSYPIARRRIDEIKENFVKFKTDLSHSGNCNNCNVCKNSV
jgi:DNA-binding LytR/AlgR family response regulator